MKISVDLNCDMGESFGAFTIGNDAELMNYVSSVNIACGFHGGDPVVMLNTVQMAVRKGVAIGAHPGYADLQGFGRREMQMKPEEIYAGMLYQLGALDAMVRTVNGSIYHVKPHGALYNAAARDAKLASSIAQAVSDFDKRLLLVGLSGSKLIDEGKKRGLKTVSEVFADRSYRDDGSLTPRTEPHAVHEDAEVVAQQVLLMALQKKVKTVTGNEISVEPETICIHGDGKHALAFARTITEKLEHHGVEIVRP